MVRLFLAVGLLAVLGHAQTFNQFTATRTSGIGPLAVTFDASDCVPNDPDAYFTYEYHWNFGDPGSGNWSYGNQESKNTAHGPIAAHVFEPSPSTQTTNYTVLLEIVAPNGDVTEQTQQITVYGAEGAQGYPGANTIVVSNTGPAGVFTGKPPNALERYRTTWASVMSLVASNTRVLLRRGETWTVDSTYTFSSNLNNAALGAFGSGADPIIDGNATDTFVYAANDVRIMDLDFRQTTGNEQTGTWIQEQPASGTDERLARHLLVLRVKVREYDQFNGIYINEQSTPSNYTSGTNHGPLTFADCRSINMVSVAKREGQWLCCADNLAVLGCEFEHPPSVAHFNVRHMWVRRGVFSNCTVHGNDSSGQNTYRIHGMKWDNPNSAYAGKYTEKFLTTGCDIDVGGGQPIWVGVHDTGAATMRFRHILMERNTLRMSDASNVQELFQLNACNHATEDNEDTLHIRRNVGIMANAGSQLCNIRRDNSQTLDPRRIRVYHNSWYTGDTRSTWVLTHTVSAADDCEIYSNVAAGANITTFDWLDDDGSGNSEDHNVDSTSPGQVWVSSTPSDPTGFKLASGSLAIDAARAGEPWLYHYDGTSFRLIAGGDTDWGDGFDCGAWERY